jgi:hypothetical protein
MDISEAISILEKKFPSHLKALESNYSFLSAK